MNNVNKARAETKIPGIMQATSESSQIKMHNVLNSDAFRLFFLNTNF